MDEDPVLDDNSRYGISQILWSVVIGVCVGLIFYFLLGLTAPFLFLIFVYMVVTYPPLLIGILLCPGVGGLIGSYIGYKTGQNMRGFASIGAIVFSFLPINWFIHQLY